MVYLTTHVTEILIIFSNGILAWVTVPEEKRPHAMRKVNHHVHRVYRAALRRPAPRTPKHRMTREHTRQMV